MIRLLGRNLGNQTQITDDATECGQVAKGERREANGDDARGPVYWQVASKYVEPAGAVPLE